MSRFHALLLLGACGNPGVKPAAPDADNTRPPTLPPADAASDASTLDFTETYSLGSQDIGRWMLTTSSMHTRMLDTSGGNPGGYLYAENSTGTPTWYTMSTHYAPGSSDSLKRDSVFVGDYAAAQITHLTVDLDVVQVGTWSSGRTLTIELRSWDAGAGQPDLVADYSLPDIDNPPAGWNHYDFMIDAGASTLPAGWSLVHGDGSMANDLEWATLMHTVDFVALGYWKPGEGYPSSNWSLGLDNIHITSR